MNTTTTRYTVKYQHNCVIVFSPCFSFSFFVFFVCLLWLVECCDFIPAFLLFFNPTINWNCNAFLFICLHCNSNVIIEKWIRQFPRGGLSCLLCRIIIKKRKWKQKTKKSTFGPKTPKIVSTTSCQLLEGHRHAILAKWSVCLEFIYCPLSRCCWPFLARLLEYKRSSVGRRSNNSPHPKKGNFDSSLLF